MSGSERMKRDNEWEFIWSIICNHSRNTVLIWPLTLISFVVQAQSGAVKSPHPSSTPPSAPSPTWLHKKPLAFVLKHTKRRHWKAITAAHKETRCIHRAWAPTAASTDHKANSYFKSDYSVLRALFAGALSPWLCSLCCPQVVIDP